MGWKSVSWEERIEIDVAPLNLVESIKELVRVAFQRLEKEGKVDSSKKKRVYLELAERDRLRAYGVTRRSGEDRMLYIGQMDLNRRGIPVESLDEIQVPDSPELVSPENIFILRGIFPAVVAEAVEDLEKAEVISEVRWHALMKLAPRQKIVVSMPTFGNLPTNLNFGGYFGAQKA